MTRADQLAVFKAQTSNVRELESAWKHLQRTINSNFIKDNDKSAKLHTKMLALVFSAWAEANFSKLIHTPHGFNLDEIHQIKAMAAGNIVDAWKKCLMLGLRRIGKPPKSNYVSNIRKRVNSLIDVYVKEPRLMRNKIAHGQWFSALNSPNTAINMALTAQLHDINIVTLCVWQDAYRGLSNIIESLIESPNRAFHRDYGVELANLEKRLASTAAFTLEKKIELLKKKAAYPRNLDVTSGHCCTNCAT